MISLDAEFLGNPVEVWLRAFLIAAGVFVGLLLIRAFVKGHFKRLISRTDNEWDDLVVRLMMKTRLFVMFMLSLYAGSIVLTFAPGVKAWINTIAVFVLLFQIAIWGNVTIDFLIERHQRRSGGQEEEITTLNAISLVARIALYFILILIGLDNIPGVEITALLASLGIGGIAVALAVNQILGDLFASVSIALDKPFVIGDLIVVGDFTGTVEEIGLKTTRVRSIQGEELIFANSDLLESRIRNFGDIAERRVIFTVGVAYETPADKLEKVPVILREAVEAQEQARFDRAHFNEFGDFSLNFETVYYVLDPVYNTRMDIHQRVSMTIFQRFTAEGIEFAYPTQTIYMADNNGASAAKST